MKSSVLKKLFIYIIFPLLIVFVVLPLLSSDSSYFGMVRVEEKEPNDDGYRISVTRLDTEEEVNVHLNDAIFFDADNKRVPINIVWEDIYIGDEYWVSMRKKSVPYRWFSKDNYNLSAFYME